VPVEELAKRLVGLLVVFGEVDAVHRLIQLPGLSQVRISCQDPLEAGPGLGFEPVGSA
jgi:hypothetical protein